MSCDKNITPNEHTQQHVATILVLHGPLFDTIEEGNPEYLDNIDSVLVRSDRTDWVGWLPVHEVEIVEQKKSPCTSAVLKFLGVKDWEQSYQIPHMVEALRDIDWDLTRMMLHGTCSVGQFRERCKEYDYFMLFVPGHVLLLNNRGETIVDTSPRTRDMRKIYAAYGLVKAERSKFKSELEYKLHEKQQMENK